MRINFSTTIAKGKLITIQNSDGTTVLSFFPAQDSSSLVFCSSSLVRGNTYKIYTGGSNSGTSFDGVFSGGTYTPGALYSTVSQTYMTTTVGRSISGPGFGIGGGDFGGPFTAPPTN